MPSDESLKQAVLEAVLECAATEGFTETNLARAAGSDLPRLFPNGVSSLIEFYSVSVDAEMEARLATLGLRQMPVRKRIRTAVLNRLEILKAHKKAAQRAAAWLAQPPHAPLAAKLLYGTVDSMWRAAGDISTDFNFYTKRGILAGVYSATLLRWFNDSSSDERDTAAFLDARIENVMQYEKLKGRVREWAKAGADQISAMLRPR